MDEELKKRVATFRLRVISDFTDTASLPWGKVEELMQEKCGRKWQIPGSMRSRISESTIKEWIALYRRSGNNLESLFPKDRSDQGKSRAVAEETASGLIVLRKEFPNVTLPVLLRQAKDRKIVPPGTTLPYSTLYRFLKSQGLVDRPAQAPKDRRKFEAEHPNDLWQSDVMHGPSVTVDGKQRKTYMIAFIDDMTRIIPFAAFYLHERLEYFLDAFRKALLMRGLPKKLYVDNGPAFRSHHLEFICASLGIVLIHAMPYQPSGKGKIERFNRNVREGFLSTTKATTLEKLNEQFQTWVTGYHDRPHGSTGEAPIKRFTKNIECVRPAPKDMEDHFRKEAKRTVARDRTFSLTGKLYEAPVDLIGKQVRLLYHEHDPARIEIRFGDKAYGFASVLDLNVNCRIKRENGITAIDPGDTPGKYKGGNLFNNTDKEADGI
ncbi:MAG TPA: DDE-type integrase/transposase/recombinase [Bacteroidota bacterium]|jgi:transposase InsO family protein